MHRPRLADPGVRASLGNLRPAFFVTYGATHEWTPRISLGRMNFEISGLFGVHILDYEDIIGLIQAFDIQIRSP
jgi:hypothetical protein